MDSLMASGKITAPAQMVKNKGQNTPIQRAIARNGVGHWNSSRPASALRAFRSMACAEVKIGELLIVFTF
jgi:hypothetical protein